MGAPGDTALEIARLIPGPVIVAEADGTILHLSPEAADLLGTDPVPVDGEPGFRFHDLLPGVELPGDRGEVVARPTVTRPDGTLAFPEVRIRSAPRSTGPPIILAAVADRRGEVAAEDEAATVRWMLDESERLAGFATWRWDIENNRVLWSDQLFTLFGEEPGSFEPNLERFLRFVHPEDLDRVRARVKLVARGTVPVEYAFRALRADGSYFRIRLRGRLARTPDGRVREIYGIATDETMHREAELDHARLMALMSCSLDGVVLKDAEGRVEAVNPAAERILEVRQEDLVGLRSEDYLPERESRESRVLLQHLAAGESDGMVFETTRDRADETTRHLAFSIAPVRDRQGQLSGTVSAIRDRSDVSGCSGSDHRDEGRDRLTGLFAGSRLMDLLPAVIARGGALFRFDLDNFNQINEVHGYEVGDRLLRGIARTIERGCPAEAALGRIGGDEFAVFIPGMGREMATRAADRFLRRIRGYVEPVETQAVTVTSSIGALVCGAGGGVSINGLMSTAGRALYRAKQKGRDSWVMVEPDLSALGIDDMGGRTWAERIHRILAEERFELYLQPVIDLQSRRAVMHEVLLRVREDGEARAPTPYLEMAEQLGLIHALDRAVMRKAFALLELNPGLTLSVNVSGKSLGDDQLLATVRDAITQHRFDPSALVIELTETAAVVDVRRAHRFAATLRELGCGFAIDDFGTGFGSYQYLKHVPVDYLKIDGEFVREGSRVDEVVIDSMVGIARGLAKKTIAEGVESEQSLERLARSGVDLAQGFAISRPAKADTVLGRSHERP